MSRSINRRPLALAFTAAMALAGCELGPNFDPPKTEAAAAYVTAPEAAAAARRTAASSQPEIGAAVIGEWWHLLGSPELDRAMRTALANNYDLASADATLAAARDNLAATEGGLYPQVSASAGLQREKVNLVQFGFKGPNPTLGLYTIGPTVSYALDVFGGTRRRIEASSAMAEEQAHQLDAAYLTLTGNVAAQALTIASLRAQIAAVGDIVASARRNLDLTRTARLAGTGTEVDVLTAQSQLANDVVLLPPLRQQLSTAYHRLAVYLGRAPAGWTPPDFDLSGFALPKAVPVALPSTLAHARPDILAAEADLAAANAQIGVAAANQYPNITISADIMQGALSPVRLFSATASGWSIGTGLTAPIFDGGRLSAERREAVDRYKASLARYHQTVLQAFAQVADALQALVNDDDELRGESAALDAARASLDLTRKSFQAGNVGVLQVLESEREFEQAELGFVRAEAQKFLDTVQLFVATGSGWRGQSA